MTDSKQESSTDTGISRADDGLNVEEQERQQRVEAIHALSGENAQTLVAVSGAANNMSAPADGQQRNGWRLAVLIGLVALVIAGSVTGYLVLSRSKQPASAQKPTAVHAIDLSASKLYCPQMPVWSPNGRQVAIVAKDVRCIEQNSTTAAEQSIAIFDVTTGKPQRIIGVKDALEQHKLSGEVNTIAWSPDGKTLAMFGPVSSASVNGANQPALILYPTTTDQQATSRVIIAPPQPNPDGTQVWNLHTMSAGPVIDAALAPALTYHWTADGHIASGQPFSSEADASTGRSANGDSVTFWQAGRLDALSAIDGQYTNQHYTTTGVVKPTGVFFSASPVLWSPNGQYVVAGVGIGGPVAYSTPPTSTLTCPGPDLSQVTPCPPNALPQPDPTFAAVVTATLKGEPFTYTDQNGNPATTSSWPEVSVAWSPNGKYLLTILPGNEERDGAKNVTATVFDTTTGSPAKQFQQNIPPGKAACYGGVPVWSPDGARIAIFQCSSDSIILWDAHGLSA